MQLSPGFRLLDRLAAQWPNRQDGLCLSLVMGSSCGIWAPLDMESWGRIEGHGLPGKAIIYTMFILQGMVV